MPSPISNQLSYTHNLEPMHGCQSLQIWQPCHGAVIIHYFAYHRRGVEAGQPGKVYRCLGVARPHQNATLSGAQWKHVTGTHDIIGSGGGVDKHFHRGRPIAG